jgi:hypothetical protein
VEYLYGMRGREAHSRQWKKEARATLNSAPVDRPKGAWSPPESVPVVTSSPDRIKGNYYY